MEYGVSEDWLRTGDGEMFAPKAEDPIDALDRKAHLDPVERSFFEAYFQLPRDQCQVIVDLLKKMAEDYRAAENDGGLEDDNDRLSESLRGTPCVPEAPELGRARERVGPAATE